MGCFLSSIKKTPSNPTTKLQTTTTHRSPPLTLPFLEDEEEEKEEVKEILSETPIIINEKNNISPEKKLSHNIHDTHVFKIAKIFNPKELTGSIRVGSDPKELGKSIRAGSGPNETAKDLERNIRVDSGRKETKEELSKSIRVGPDPKEATKGLSRHIRAGSDQKEMKEDLSTSIRVGLDPKEATKGLSRHIRVGSDQKEMKEDLSRSIRAGSDPKETTIKNIRQKSPVKHRNTSPARRSDHLSGSGQARNISPARKPDHPSGSSQARNVSPARKLDPQTGSGPTRNISPGRAGSGSCRRPRSPVICGDQINGGTKNSISRCPSSRKSGKSPGRVRSELGDRRRSPVTEGGNGSRSNRENNNNNNNNNNNYKKNLTSGINESIENPHLSFECFIFI